MKLKAIAEAIKRMHSADQNLDASRFSQTAQATILKRWETDIVFNGMPQIGLLLEVHPIGGTVFRVEVRTVVTRAHLAFLQPGAALEVSFDPARPTRVVISALPGAP